MSIHDAVLMIPHDFECEQAILGAIILDNSIFNEVCAIIKPNTFHTEAHRHIFRAIVELNDNQSPVDELTIGDKLKEIGELESVGSYQYLHELTCLCPSTFNAQFYANIIKDHATLRDLISLTADIGRKARDPRVSVQEIISELESKTSTISESANQGKTEHIKDVLVRRIEAYEERSAAKKDIVGIPTGFYELDSMLSGLIAPNMISVAADSGVGKSAFAFNIVENIYTKTDEKRPTFIVSREMSSDEIADRFICSASKIDTSKFKVGKIDQLESDRMFSKAESLLSSNILINDYFHTFDQVANEARYLHRHAENGICFMVIDYLQLLEGVSKSNREQEVSYMSRNTKRLAKELNIPIMPLSQLNRDLRRRSDKHPIRSDLRESAAIEHDSDILIFIYRDEFYNKDSEHKGIAEIIIDKHRNGPTGMIELSFSGRYTRFDNFTRHYQ